MVNSGSFNTSGFENRYLTFSWEIISQDIANNTTTIFWSIKGAGKAISGWYWLGTLKIKINDEYVYNQSADVKLYEGTVVKTGTYTIKHNDDGSKTFTANVEAAIYTTALNCYGNGSWELPTIPRQADLVSAPDFNDEANPTITYSNPAGNSVSSLQACISLTGAKDDVAYRDINKTGSSYTFNLTESERNVLRTASTNSNSLSVQFYVRTKIDTKTYCSAITKTMTIINANPTFSNFVYKDTNTQVVNITGNNQILVKGLSTLQAVISTANKMVANKKSNPKNYITTINSTNISSNYITDDLTINVGTINSAGTQRLSVRAYDSRNNSTLAYKDITIYDYNKPVINASVSRLNNFENQTTLKVAGTYSKLVINNVSKNIVKTLQYRYREANGTWSSWNTLTSTINDGKFTCNDVILSLDNTKSFEFEIQVIDNLETNTLSLALGIGQAIFFISSNKKACYINGQEILTYDIVDTW